MYEHGDHETTANGHCVKCEAWKAGSQINYTVYIDGDDYTSGSSDDDFGRSSALDEAKHQSEWTAREITEGILAKIGAEWVLQERAA